jgi:ADP-heptose:LPS heptosyltransferase
LADARRLLAIRLDNAGDVVLLGPAIGALRDACPEATIDLLASPAGARAAALMPFDRVHRLEAPWQDASGSMPLDPAREWRVVRCLGEGRFDAALIFTSFSQTPWPAAYACYLAGIPLRAAHASGFGGSVLTHQVDPVPDDWHEADRNAHLVEALGVPVRQRALAIAIPDRSRERVASMLADEGIGPRDAIALVTPGASASARRLPAERTGRIAARIAARHGLRVVVAGSEREALLARAVQRAAPGGSVSLAGRSTLEELAALVERASLVLTANSLAMHLADATRTPALVLFAGTDRESNWAPRYTRSVTLRHPTGCAPCFAFDCPFDQECLGVREDTAVASAATLLSRPHTTQSRWLASAS